MVDATNPFLPIPIYRMSPDAVKTARPDIILQDEVLPDDVMEDMIFSEIGGEEILSVSRSDLINSPFDNVYTLRPINTQDIIPIPLPGKVTQTLISKYKPTDGTSVIRKDSSQSYTVEDDGSIIINTVNVSSTQQVEIQIYGGSNYYNDTKFL